MYIPNPYLEIHAALMQSNAHLSLLRKKLIWAYSWAIPNREAIDALRSHSPLVELGAGTGYWAWLARCAGADVIAYDREPAQPPRWTEIQQGDPASLREHRNRTLLLCWPPLGEPMALQALREHQGHRVIYVGEVRGRTADDEFHRELEQKFRLIERIEIPRWPGFEDALFVYERA